MEMLAGTSGYSYKEWLGRFYPEKLPAAEMLRYYAERFRTVEINNTFYRMPAEAMLARWAEEVPEHFAFTLKAPRRITHDKRLREAEGEVGAFVQRAAALGSKLGVLLFQLPPYLRKDVPRLQAFLDLLPAETRAAFEFRHASWQDDEVYEALRARAAMLCVTDTDDGRHAVRCDRGLRVRSLAAYALRRRRSARLGRAHRGRAARSHLRLFHARGRGGRHAVRTADERAVACGR